MVVDHWDLGSIPRSPEPLFLFFHNMFLCRRSKAFHHVLQAIRRQVATNTHLMAKREYSWCSLVNRHVVDQKGQTWLKQLGFQNSRFTSIWAQNPLGSFLFPFYFIFSSLFINYFSNYYYYH